MISAPPSADLLRVGVCVEVRMLACLGLTCLAQGAHYCFCVRIQLFFFLLRFPFLDNFQLSDFFGFSIAFKAGDTQLCLTKGSRHKHSLSYRDNPG